MRTKRAAFMGESYVTAIMERTLNHLVGGSSPSRCKPRKSSILSGFFFYPGAPVLLSTSAVCLGFCLNQQRTKNRCSSLSLSGSKVAVDGHGDVRSAMPSRPLQKRQANARLCEQRVSRMTQRVWNLQCGIPAALRSGRHAWRWKFDGSIKPPSLFGKAKSCGFGCPS